MKGRILTILLLTVGLLTAQSDQELADIYFKKSKNSFEKSELESSLKYFDKAEKLFDSISEPRLARLGTLIHNELANYEKAKSYAKHYFSISKNKNSSEYQELLGLYVDIQEKIEDEKIAELERMIREKKTREENKIRKRDSLKAIWITNSKRLSLEVDRIYELNEYSVALFKKDVNFGVLDDKGNILVKAEEYLFAKEYDAYILLLNSIAEPTKIYCYNSKTKEGFSLPNISVFNPTSTHYGHIMMPRANGIFVSYPNNSLEVLKFDLSSRKFIKIGNKEEYLKKLKKEKVIKSYKKDNEIKIGKLWYKFGGHLGGGIHPVYNIDKSIYGYLCSIDGTLLSFKDYNYIGSYFNKKAEVLNGNESYWINHNGTKVKAPKDESGKYSGNSKIIRLENKKYQFHHNDNGIESIILGNKAIETLSDFLTNHMD